MREREIEENTTIYHPSRTCSMELMFQMTRLDNHSQMPNPRIIMIRNNLFIHSLTCSLTLM